MQSTTSTGEGRIPTDDIDAVILHTINVADQTLTYRQVSIDDLTPTGTQIAIAAGFKSVDGVSVLQVLATGDLEDVRPNETVDLRREGGRFVIVESDRAYRLTIDGQRFDWPCRIVSGGLLRKLGQVPTDKVIYFERRDQPDRQVDDQDLVDLDAAGVESFVSRKLVWKLNVQGVVLELFAPTIVVREALVEAGFNPDQGWQIFLKIVGQQKQPVELTTLIDAFAIADVCGRVDYVQPGGSTLQDRGVYAPESLRGEYLRKVAPDAHQQELDAGYLNGMVEEAPAVITLNMRAASACVNEFISRAFPFRLESNRIYARTQFSLAACEEEHFSEDVFKRAPNRLLARGDTEPLLGLPALKAPTR